MNKAEPDKITTRSCQNFCFQKLLRLEEQPLLLDDIAHGLAKFNRYVGQGGPIDRTYSVAEHCVHVAMLVTQWAMKSGMSPKAIRECARWALMHDAPEAYLGDLSRGLKQLIRLHTEIYDVLETNLEILITRRFDLHPTDITRTLAKRADIAIVGPEFGALWEGRMYVDRREDQDDDVSSVIIGQWDPPYAKQRFLEMCEHLDIR